MDKPQNNQGNVEDVAWCPKCNAYCEKIWGQQENAGIVHKVWSMGEYREDKDAQEDRLSFSYYCGVCDTPVLWEPTEKEKAEAIIEIKTYGRDADDIRINGL